MSGKVAFDPAIRVQFHFGNRFKKIIGLGLRKARSRAKSNDRDAGSDRTTSVSVSLYPDLESGEESQRDFVIRITGNTSPLGKGTSTRSSLRYPRSV